VVEGDGLEPWRLDPANPYRAYAAGLENSGLRVPDCSRPALVVLGSSASRAAPGEGRLEASLEYDPREALGLGSVRAELRSATTSRPLSAAELSVEPLTRAITIQLSGLPDGKHTVALTPVDAGGLEGDSTLLPFWIEAQSFDWRDALVYLAFTDRFRNGDPSNDPAPSDTLPGADFMGGDLVGLRAAIDEGYFDELGVNVLWVTPWNTNPALPYDDAGGLGGVSGFHGYWPIEARGVDPRFGTLEELRAMVAAAHARGIRVLMDLVVNHVHEEHPYFRDHPEWFRTGCVCGTAGCDWTGRRLDCLFRPYMPDVDWQHPGASEQMLADALYWLEAADLDGFRVDAVKHVEDGAVINLRVRVRERFEQAGLSYFLMGETAMGWDASAGPDAGSNPENYGVISRYIGPDALHGQFDFVLYHSSALSFGRDDPGRGMLHVDFWTRASLDHYPPGAIMTPYIGSHDTSRYISLITDPARAGNKWSDLPADPMTDEPYERLYAAFAWLLALPGAPLMYYGDEYGQAGGADPDNRRGMRFGASLTAREAALRDRVAALGRARASLPGLRSGAYRSLSVSDDLWSVARGAGAERVLVLLNRGATPLDLLLPLPTDVAVEGEIFEDALEPAFQVVVTRQAIQLTLAPRSARYLALR
ncbi:MAG: alpha-amylase family glycosyl hydrolase, partial [Myxococcales bacterium]|nr:alpha-amylase family glycosyl hydrolase [Myxococcales bacterium]